MAAGPGPEPGCRCRSAGCKALGPEPGQANRALAPGPGCKAQARGPAGCRYWLAGANSWAAPVHRLAAAVHRLAAVEAHTSAEPEPVGGSWADSPWGANNWQLMLVG
jgi:hypothetical protein